jgi:hypothetical protein
VKVVDFATNETMKDVEVIQAVADANETEEWKFWWHRLFQSTGYDNLSHAAGKDIQDVAFRYAEEQ